MSDTVLTPGSAAAQRRRRLGLSTRSDIWASKKDQKRVMVYRLHDAAGAVLYIGRSSDVRTRIKAHHSDATGNGEGSHKREWFFDVRSVSMVGPFTWDEACQVERIEIEQHQPRGNRMHTRAHGWHPLTEGGGRVFSDPSP